jgi:hypothetical protein
VPDNRLNENHALLLTFHRLIGEIIGINHDLHPYIEKIGQIKTAQCEQRHETVADSYFNILMNQNFTIDNDPCLDLVDEEGLVYVHLEESLKKFRNNNHSFNVPTAALQNSLREHPAFYASGVRHRFQSLAGSLRKRAWVFHKDKII